jgi:elongation factor Ts
MANITAGMVKELRDQTGAGMMGCKAALTEVNGDIEAAVDWLRTKGLAKAAKKAGRVAAEGLVGVATDGNKAAVVEINSETDFVARNDQFQSIVSDVAQVALNVGDHVEAISNAPHPAGGTVASVLADAIATIGENMTLRRAARLSVEQGVVSAYVHNAVSSDKANLGRIAVLVALESPSQSPDLATLGRQIAMHVAAVNPVALSADLLPADVIERERQVLAEKARESGKPDAVIAKIVESGIKSYQKEVCLLDQPFVHDGSKTVGQVLKEAEGRFGGPVVLKEFVRFGLGEGVEKVESDFAAEVAAAAGAA